MMNNLPAPVELEPEVYACSHCSSTDHWIDLPDNTWVCTNCNTAHDASNIDY